MGITTKEIAKICGVSRTTVHRALNNTGRISEKTKRMILETAEKNGYRPDLLATRCWQLKDVMKFWKNYRPTEG